MIVVRGLIIECIEPFFFICNNVHVCEKRVPVSIRAELRFCRKVNRLSYPFAGSIRTSLPEASPYSCTPRGALRNSLTSVYRCTLHFALTPL